MEFVKISTAKLSEIRTALIATKSLEKRASVAEHAADIYRRVLAIVADGGLDPSVALDKVAEFLEDTDSLRLLEVGYAAGPSPKLGSLTEGGSGSLEETPEGRLEERLSRHFDNFGYHDGR